MTFASVSGMTLPASKRAARTQLFDARKALTPSQRATANAAICERLHRVLQRLDAHSVAAYMPTSTEPGGTDLATTLASLGYEVIIPISNADHTLSWVRLTPDTQFRTGVFGIAEPVSPPLGGQPLSEVDVIIVPALASDTDGYRLGKGGGYYDRALAELANPVTVSLLFDHEVFDRIPREDHDSRTAAIITDQKLLGLMEPFVSLSPSM